MWGFFSLLHTPYYVLRLNINKTIFCHLLLETPYFSRFWSHLSKLLELFIFAFDMCWMPKCECLFAFRWSSCVITYIFWLVHHELGWCINWLADLFSTIQIVNNTRVVLYFSKTSILISIRWRQLLNLFIYASEYYYLTYSCVRNWSKLTSYLTLIFNYMIY